MAEIGCIFSVFLSTHLILYAYPCYNMCVADPADLRKDISVHAKCGHWTRRSTKYVSEHEASWTKLGLFKHMLNYLSFFLMFPCQIHKVLRAKT